MSSSMERRDFSMVDAGVSSHVPIGLALDVWGLKEARAG